MGLGCVGVDAPDAGELVAEPLAFEGFGDTVFVHPGAVGVAQVVESEPGNERLPAPLGVTVAGGSQRRRGGRAATRRPSRPASAAVR
jgi:hypothetical protein